MSDKDVLCGVRCSAVKGVTPFLIKYRFKMEFILKRYFFVTYDSHFQKTIQ